MRYAKVKLSRKRFQRRHELEVHYSLKGETVSWFFESRVKLRAEGQLVGWIPLVSFYLDVATSGRSLIG